MSRYIAFLRAINVGGHVVKMDALRRMFETIGCFEVETVIASGNVIFDSTSKGPAALEKKIEEHLRRKLGYEVSTFLRTPAEMAAVARYQPFKESELNAPGNVLYVGFLAEAPAAAAKKKLMTFTNDVDEIHVQGREVYWLCHKKFSESKFSGAQLERTLEMATTLRNVNTVRRIAAKVALALLFAMAPSSARAQAPAADSPLQSAEGVVRELYRYVTVEKGQVTDWEEVRKLFIPEAVIVLRVSKDASTVFDVQGWIDDFVAWNEKAHVKERGFSEKIIVLEPRVFRDIANVFVLYEAALTDSDRPPSRGVDSIELIRKDGRWWIVSITNDLPNAENPIPAQLQE
jgi:uncharacterized protein (DUF1697 family)